jgi:hypothetical protein
MRLRAVTILLLAAASCAGPPRRFPVRAPTGDLQPLDLGLEWIYDLDGQTQIRHVVGTERVGRFECRVVEARTGPVVERFWMRWEKDGLKVYRASDGQNAVEFDDPVVQIHRLAGPGQAWSFEETHGPVTLAVEGKYEGDDEFKLGLKTYKSMRIRLVKRVAGRVVVDQTCWYVMDIGLVRMSVVVAGDEGETRSKLKLKSCNFLPE